MFNFLCCIIRVASYTCTYVYALSAICIGDQPTVRIDVVLCMLEYSRRSESTRYRLPAEYILMSIFLLIVALQIVTYPSGGSSHFRLQWSWQHLHSLPGGFTVLWDLPFENVIIVYQPNVIPLSTDRAEPKNSVEVQRIPLFPSVPQGNTLSLEHLHYQTNSNKVWFSSGHHIIILQEFFPQVSTSSCWRRNSLIFIKFIHNNSLILCRFLNGS